MALFNEDVKNILSERSRLSRNLKAKGMVSFIVAFLINVLLSQFDIRKTTYAQEQKESLKTTDPTGTSITKDDVKTLPGDKLSEKINSRKEELQYQIAELKPYAKGNPTMTE